MLGKKETVEMEDMDSNYYKSFKETVFLINTHITETIKNIETVNRKTENTTTLFYQMLVNQK